MLKLCKVRIKNFKEEREIDLNFANDSVTIIYGLNGSGKTTLLRLIHALLSMNDNLLSAEKITEGEMIFKDSISEELCFIGAKYDNSSNNYTWNSDIKDLEEFHEGLSSMVFGVNRGITLTAASKVTGVDLLRYLRMNNCKLLDEGEKPVISHLFFEEYADFVNRQVKMRTKRFKRARIDLEFHEVKHLMLDNLPMDLVEILLMEKYLEEKSFITDRVQKALFETLAGLVEEKNNNIRSQLNDAPRNFVNKLSKYHDTLIEALSELNENELLNNIIKILRNYNPNSGNENNPFHDNEILYNLVYNMIEELDRGKGVINSVTQLIDEFNSYLSKNKRLEITERGPRILTNKSKHSLEKLSSGERHLLSFLTLFIIVGKERNFLLIDEPEISLNLEWQERLLPMLTKFVPESQIIVATHSPSIAAYNTNNLVELV